MAEQREPVRRKVALKIIKPGMDTREVIARFEAERQALAMMDHPDIAKVFDADATESGRPYFVMELVHGSPLTEYCEQIQLTTRERLELLAQVCLGVQHAHQKGIIHRDLKPSNVLVARYDGVPVPKIIDFGIAKAINQQPADAALADYSDALRLDPGTAFRYSDQAVASLAAGKIDLYRSAARAMLEHFALTKDPSIGTYVAQVCAYGRDAVTDWPKVVALAEMAEKNNPTSAWCQRGVEMVLYRAGRFEEALRHLNEANGFKGNRVNAGQFRRPSDGTLWPWPIAA
jgi:serine/threonine protein kinase